MFYSWVFHHFSILEKNIYKKNKNRKLKGFQTYFRVTVKKYILLVTFTKTSFFTCLSLSQQSISLKTDSHLPKNFCFTCFNDSPSKMMKNAFYFILKALFALKMFTFLSWLFGHVEKNGLIRKIRLILKLMPSQPGSQTITIHVLLNISRIKGNQIMKSGQLIEYNKRNIFLQKSCRKWGPLFVF